jgi:hypothetical protein
MQPSLAPGARDPVGTTPAPDGPWSWLVVWGTIGRGGLVVEEVTAFDSDEALVLAGERRPDLARPRVAFLASGQRPA